MKLSLAAIIIGAPSILGFAPSSLRSTTTTTTSTGLFAAKYKVFIDGEAGTTGLQVRGRIEAREDLEIISPPSDLRKDVDTRKKFINEADVVILCTFVVYNFCVFYVLRYSIGTISPKKF
jgi:N-acetyl-gamma-glutamyl-phosphate reductase